MGKYISLILVFLMSLYTGSASAFNERETHPKLTENAIRNSDLQTYLVNYLGYPSGIDSLITGLDRNGWPRNNTVSKWLQDGSTDEDALSLCRASNHFHNPIHLGDWSQSQMSDSPEVDLACGTTNRYSDVTWATGYTSPAPSDTTISRYGQANGWDNARSYYYDALISTNPVSGVLTREGLFARTFRSLGMVMHLLQDMAVPAHVRNDMKSHLWNAYWPGDWGNSFEKYVTTNVQALQNAPIKPV